MITEVWIATGGSRVFTGHTDPVSISLMRHKSRGLHQPVSQPNLLPALDAPEPAVAPEPEVTQLANGADEPWRSAAALARE